VTQVKKGMTERRLLDAMDRGQFYFCSRVWLALLVIGVAFVPSR